MSRETKVPSIPHPQDDNVLDVLRAIKATLEVREGQIGNPLDQNATLRDLVDLSLLQGGGSTTLTGGRSVPVIPGGGVLPPLPGGYNPGTDYTTPPAPTGLTVRGGFTNCFLEWNGAPYRNHNYTEIWRSTVDNLGTAVMVGTTAANVYADAAQPDTEYFYWIRFVSKANVTGAYNQTSGTSGRTALDVTAAITALSNNLANSQLYIDLGTRITATETGIREIRDVTGSSAKLVTTLASVVGSNTAALQLQASVVDGLSAQYTVKTDVNGHVAGFGLATTSVNGTPTSAFIVRADRFGIAGVNDPADPTPLEPDKVPFMVNTAPITIGGKTYPIGTWINTAFIANATIDTAQIKDLTADKITAGSLTATIGITTGKISGGVNLDYAFGSVNYGTGFFLGNDGGTYKFRVGSYDSNVTWNGSSLTVTGTINATSGTFRNITVYDTSNNVILSSGGINTALLGLGSLAYQSSVSSGQVTGLGALATQNTVTLGTQTTGNYVSSVSGRTGAVSLSTADVNGLGALATANDVFIGSNVKISNGAGGFVTLNTGDFVNALSKITPTNVSTFIESAAIASAYIGNLDAAKITTGYFSANRLQIGNNSGSNRIQMFDDRIEVYQGGTMRVRIGNLG